MKELFYHINRILSMINFSLEKLYRVVILLPSRQAGSVLTKGKKLRSVYTSIHFAWRNTQYDRTGFASSFKFVTWSVLAEKVRMYRELIDSIKSSRYTFNPLTLLKATRTDREFVTLSDLTKGKKLRSVYTSIHFAWRNTQYYRTGFASSFKFVTLSVLAEKVRMYRRANKLVFILPIGRARVMAVLMFLVGLSFNVDAQWMKIDRNGGNPVPSAALEISDTSRGLLPPRLTTTQMNAISSPASGLLLYNTDSALFYYYDGAWKKVTVGADNLGNHTATQNIKLGSNSLSNDGDSEGISISNAGWVTITPATTGAGQNGLDVKGDIITTGQGTGLKLTNGNIKILGNLSNSGDMQLYTGGTSRMRIVANGKTGIGTTSPDSLLTVAGGINAENIRLSNGAGASKVLTSDATGNGSWQTLTAPVPAIMQDTDADTKIQMEESTDEDIIRFDLGGTEYFRMNKARLEPENSGFSVFVGEEAGLNDDYSNNHNAFVGYRSGRSTTTGNQNTALGSNSLYSSATGSNNIAIGYSAGWSIRGNNNTAVGSSALAQDTSGSFNTALGMGALGIHKNGSGNVAIGGLSLNRNEVGTGNIAIGQQAGYNELGSNKLYIENSLSATPLIYGDFANDSLRFNGAVRIRDEFYLDSSNAAAGKVLTSNADGKATWQTPSSTTAVFDYNVGDQAIFSDSTDYDFVVGSTQLDDVGGTSGDSRMIFDKSVGAFRAGIADSTEWDSRDTGTAVLGGRNNSISAKYGVITGGIDNVVSSTYSVALGGQNNTVSGNTSIVGGWNNLASGKTSTAIGGYQNSATGDFSAALGGTGLYAPSAGEIAIGFWNTNYTPNSAVVINANDRLLVVGNGTNGGAGRKNALIIYKSGHTILNGRLWLSNGSDSIRLPNTDGTAGQVLQTNGSGNVTWQTPTSSPWALVNDTVSVSGKRVGIGTTGPEGALHVTTAANERFILDNSANDATLDLRGANAKDSRIRFRSGGVNKFQVGYEDTYKRLTWAGPNWASALMRLDTLGKLGIGSNPIPAYHLDMYNDNDSTIYLRMAHAGTGISNGFQGLRIGYDQLNASILNYENGKLTFGNNGTTDMTIDSIGRVGIGTSNPNSSAILDLTSTTKAFLPPRLTSTEILAIPNPVAGMMVYNTTAKCPFYYNGSDWYGNCGSPIGITSISPVAFSGTGIGGRTNPTNATDDEIGVAICTDASNNYYITGYFDGTLKIGADDSVIAVGNIDMFIAKFNSSDSLQWLKSVGGGGNEVKPAGITVDGSGNVYVTGNFKGTIDFDPSGSTANLSPFGGIDAFVLKLTSAGVYAWANRYGDNTEDDFGYGIASDGTNVYMCGAGDGTVRMSTLSNLVTNGVDAIVVKINASGVNQWRRNGEAPGDKEIAYGIDANSSGDVFITGQFEDKAWFGSGASDTAYAFNGRLAVFITKYNTSGTVQWVQEGKCDNESIGFGLALDASSNAYITGSFKQKDIIFGNDTLTSGRQNEDVFITKLNSSGTFQWSKAAISDGASIGRAIDADNEGNLALGGSFSKTLTYSGTGVTANGQTDAFMIRMRQDVGTLLWIKEAGSTGQTEFATGISTQKTGDVIRAIGGFKTTMLFGASSITAVGGYDVFIWKYE